uniref:Uncharacterized protein n=1 Tax=Physcomitrium patens TaxID=3218 RepID=A0A7I4D9Y4_PHYPA
MRLNSYPLYHKSRLQIGIFPEASSSITAPKLHTLAATRHVSPSYGGTT